MKKLLALVLVMLTLASLIPAATADGENINKSWLGEVISQQVSLYKEANTSSGYHRRLKNGTVFYIQEKKGTWAYAAVPSEKKAGEYDYGWIRTEYIMENPTHIVLRDSAGVYAYAAPYNTDKRVGTVSDYDRFTVIATTGSYYIVSFRNAVCYLPMNADYWIEEDLAAELARPSTPYYVSAKQTKVYGYTNTSHGSLKTLKKGAKVDVLYVQDSWAAIRYETVIAYVKMADLALQ